jgi:mediator of RNA polymerase II transcription subunit 5
LTFVYRYEISPEDLEISNQDSFILRFLVDGGRSQQLEDLTEEENKQLGSWLLGMYNEGTISDELMSSCIPQQFYLLVPTLVYQSILASASSKLNQESLKGGLDCTMSLFPSDHLLSTTRSTRNLSAPIAHQSIHLVHYIPVATTT